ncbi:pitrilysin family protein [Persicobacter psychrovividus]|uniref:Zinc protease n=1 Tax=Persicobacter psychrovividus TaxID=387638 RepID=A0ABM7VGS5_9BACT|nr:zinc protease [Persicobacter psychrovividus]
MIDRSIAPKFERINKFNIQKVTPFKLTNGRKLHYLRSDAQPVVKIELLFKTGHIHESKTGMCSFAFKMLSEGVDGLSGKEIAEFIEHHGAQIDVSPGTDYSSVAIYCLRQHTEALLPILHKIVNFPTFPEQELETAKTQRKQSIMVNLEKNSFIASRAFRNALFGVDHPYGKVWALEDIDAVTTTDCRDFFNDHIRNKFEVLLCGDVDDQLIAQIDELFGQERLSNKNESTQLPPIVSATSPVHVQKADSLQSAIRIGRPIFTKKHEDYAALSIINEILGGYFGSRLMKNIREDKGYTYGIHSSLYSFQSHGYWAIGAEVNGENTKEAVIEIHKEVQKLIDEPVPAEELEIVQNYILGQYLSSVNTPFALLEKFKSVYLFGQGYEYYDQYLDVLNAVTPASLQKIAAQYWQKDDLIEIVVGKID